METISSKDNKNIKEYVRLATSKKHRDEQQLFAIESVKLIIEAINSDVRIKKVFVTQACLEKNNEALQKLFEKTNTIYLIDEIIENKMTQINNSGGIFAICEYLQINKEIPNNGKFIFLCELQDSGNVGTIIRTSKALAMDGIIISKNMCDIFSPKVIRSSMGALFKLPIYIADNKEEYLNQLNEKFDTYATVIDEDAQLVQDVVFNKNSVLVIGNEGNGLPQQTVSLCKQKITIPMKGEMESLNAAIACGILIWELSK